MRPKVRRPKSWTAFGAGPGSPSWIAGHVRGRRQDLLYGDTLADLYRWQISLLAADPDHTPGRRSGRREPRVGRKAPGWDNPDRVERATRPIPPFLDRDGRAAYLTLLTLAALAWAGLARLLALFLD